MSPSACTVTIGGQAVGLSRFCAPQRRLETALVPSLQVPNGYATLDIGQKRPAAKGDVCGAVVAGKVMCGANPSVPREDGGVAVRAGSGPSRS